MLSRMRLDSYSAGVDLLFYKDGFNYFYIQKSDKN